MPPNTTAIPAPALTPNAIQTYLNGIYKSSNVEFTITSDTTQFDLGTGANAGLERSDESMFGKYSLEMRALKSHYMAKHPNYNKKATYIFVVPSFTGGLEGFMVRGRSVGFVTGAADMRTYAHELGHGVFGLDHTFPEIEKGESNNLMDYGTGTHLTHEQWKIMHARKPAYSWFDSEESGAYETDGHYSTVYLVSLMLGMDKELAHKLAVATEAPDTKVHSDIEFELNTTWAYPFTQQYTHSLTGGYHGVEELMTALSFLYTPKSNIRELGILLHRFGDTYAHTRLDNLSVNDLSSEDDETKEVGYSTLWKGQGGVGIASRINPWIKFLNKQIKRHGQDFLIKVPIQRGYLNGKSINEYLRDIYLKDRTDKFIMYGSDYWSMEHLQPDGGLPDLIYVRPDWYLAYVRNLASLIASKYELDAQKMNMPLFTKMVNFAVANRCSLKGIIDYEVAVKLGKKVFYIPIYEPSLLSPISIADAIRTSYPKSAKIVLDNTKKYLTENNIRFREDVETTDFSYYYAGKTIIIRSIKAYKIILI